MEVKYSKGSKTLADLKNQFEKEYEQEVANRARNEETRMKKEGFLQMHKKRLIIFLVENVLSLMMTQMSFFNYVMEKCSINTLNTMILICQ